MWYQNIRSPSFSFVTIHASGGQRDGRTDRIPTAIPCVAYMQSHGKNFSVPVSVAGVDTVPCDDGAVCTGAGNLPECVLHVRSSDTAAGHGVHAKRPADPHSAGVQASHMSYVVATLRGSIRDEHHHRHGCYRDRVTSLSHAGPRATGEINHVVQVTRVACTNTAVGLLDFVFVVTRHVTRYSAQC